MRTITSELERVQGRGTKNTDILQANIEGDKSYETGTKKNNILHPNTKGIKYEAGTKQNNILHAETEGVDLETKPYEEETAPLRQMLIKDATYKGDEEGKTCFRTLSRMKNSRTYPAPHDPKTKTHLNKGTKYKDKTEGVKYEVGPSRTTSSRPRQKTPSTRSGPSTPTSSRLRPRASRTTRPGPSRPASSRPRPGAPSTRPGPSTPTSSRP